MQPIVPSIPPRNAQPRIEGVRIMSVKARGIAACVSSIIILAMALVAAPSLAQTPAKSIKNQLLGHWQLVSVTINGNTPYGAAPQGSMFFDVTGHYSVIVITGGKASSISYFGTYTVNDADSSVTMHIDASSLASAAGRDETRLVTFSGDQLIVENQRSGGPLGDIKLTWQQAN